MFYLCGKSTRFSLYYQGLEPNIISQSNRSIKVV